MNDTSGIAYQFNAPKALAKLYLEAGLSDGLLPFKGTLGDSVRRIAEGSLANHPGRKWELGMSIDVVGYLVEVFSGMPLDQFLEQRIFKPLGMNDTHGFLPKEKIPRLAAVYGPTPDGGIKKHAKGRNDIGPFVFTTDFPYAEPHEYFSASSQLTSTAGDYAGFFRCF